MSTDTFGDRLQTERENRGLSLRFVAEILRVDEDLLLALERDDFDALPDESEMRDYLHRYAECLEVDADLMIEDYLRERDRWLRQVAGPVPAGIRKAVAGRPRSLLLLAALIAVAIVVPAGWWMLSRKSSDLESEVPGGAGETSRVLSATAEAFAPGEPGSGAASLGAPADPVEEAAVEEPSPLPEPSAEADPPQPAPSATEPPADIRPAAAEPPAPPEPPAAPKRPQSPTLRIVDYGVGTGVEDRRLVGEGDRFAEGMQVWFWTRVLGAHGGATIEHVWLREGVVMMRVPLEIGGPSWRTHSTSTLRAAGNWAVEARDVGGRVLARSEFVCGR